MAHVWKAESFKKLGHQGSCHPRGFWEIDLTPTGAVQSCLCCLQCPSRNALSFRRTPWSEQTGWFEEGEVRRLSK